MMYMADARHYCLLHTQEQAFKSKKYICLTFFSTPF
jgi:hypothetical protein